MLPTNNKDLFFIIVTRSPTSIFNYPFLLNIHFYNNLPIKIVNMTICQHKIIQFLLGMNFYWDFANNNDYIQLIN